MKKVNKKKSLQLGLATLSLISIMSGCAPKKEATNSQQSNNDIKMINSLLKTNERTYEIEKILKISDELNEDLKENNLLGELKEVDDTGVEYYNYDVKNIEFLNLDNYTFEELLIFGENIEKLTEEQKLFLRAYTNNWLYHNNLLINYEDLARVILSLETGKEFVPLLEDTDDKIYLREIKEIIEGNKSLNIPDYEIIRSHYNISEYSAKNIATLVKNMPTPGYMVKAMTDENIPDFGPEDFIPELDKQIKNSTKVIRTMNWQYYEDTLNREEPTTNESKKVPTTGKIKLKARK